MIQFTIARLNNCLVALYTFVACYVVAVVVESFCLFLHEKQSKENKFGEAMCTVHKTRWCRQMKKTNEEQTENRYESYLQLRVKGI